MGPQQTDGKWLEKLIEDTAELIKDWDIAKCQPWAIWDDRKRYFPESTEKDLGIDLVAIRRSDGEYIAIQSKSRQLDESNSGNSISFNELSTFIGLSAADLWAERWVVTNGNCPLGDNLSQVKSMTDKPIKLVNIVNDLLQQQTSYTVEVCAHCKPHTEGEEVPKQTKTCMQSEAIDTSVRLLKKKCSVKEWRASNWSGTRQDYSSMRHGKNSNFIAHHRAIDTPRRLVGSFVSLNRTCSSN